MRFRAACAASSAGSPNCGGPTAAPWCFFAFTLVSSGVAIAYPLVFKLVLDRIGEGLASSTGGFPRALLQNALAMLGAIAVARFLAGFYPGARAYMNLTFDRLVRTRVFTSLLGEDHHFFRRFRTGDLVTRLLDNISEYPKISWFLCSGFFRALDSGSKITFCVAAMFLLDWRLSLLAVLPLPLLLWCIYAVRQKLTSASDAQAKAVSETNDLLEATFSGVRIVKAFRAEERDSRARWAKSSVAASRCSSGCSDSGRSSSCSRPRPAGWASSWYWGRAG